MYTQKEKWQRSFAPSTPDYHQKKQRTVWSSIGTAIILISIIIVIFLGLWVVAFNAL